MDNASYSTDAEEVSRLLALQVMDFSGASLSKEIILNRLQSLCPDAEYAFQQMLEFGWIEADYEGGGNAAA